MSVSAERLSDRQIAAMRQLAICCANGGQVTLRRDQREAMVPLWHRGIVEVWHRIIPDEGARGPFYRPTERGWRLIGALFSYDPQRAAA